LVYSIEGNIIYILIYLLNLKLFLINKIFYFYLNSVTMITNLQNIDSLSVIDNQYVTKQNGTFYIRESGIFSVKRFITDSDGNELFKFKLLRDGFTLFGQNKNPILNATVNTRGNKELNIYIGNEKDKLISVFRKNLKSNYGEQSYTASFFNKTTGNEEVLEIVHNKFKKNDTVYLYKGTNNERIICKIQRSGRKFSLEVPAFVDYVYMITIGLCLLKFSDIENLESFEQANDGNQINNYQYS